MKSYEELKELYMPKLKWYQKILQKLHIKRYYFNSWCKWSKEPFKKAEIYYIKKEKNK